MQLLFPLLNSNFTATNVDNATFRYNSTDGKFELLYKCGNTYSLVGWNDNSFSYDYYDGSKWVRKWDAISDLQTKAPLNECSLWLNGGQSVTALFIAKTTTSQDCARVPIMVGGNINGIPFLRLYNIDFSSISSSMTTQTNYVDIVATSYSLVLSANANGGRPNEHRIKIVAPSDVGTRIFIKDFSDCYLKSATIS